MNRPETWGLAKQIFINFLVAVSHKQAIVCSLPRVEVAFCRDRFRDRNRDIKIAKKALPFSFSNSVYRQQRPFFFVIIVIIISKNLADLHIFCLNTFKTTEVGIYKRKILRKKEENTLSTKKKGRFKKKRKKTRS